MALDVIPNQVFRSCKHLELGSASLFYFLELFSNYISSVIYEFPWQAGITAFACYLFGIAHTVSNVNKPIPLALFIEHSLTQSFIINRVAK
jgi:hypothetical protein